MGVRIFLQICHPFGVAICCRDVSGYPPHGTVTVGFTRPGGAATSGEAATAEVRRKMGVHLSGGSKRRGGVQAERNLHSEDTEYGRTIYCDTTNHGPVQGGGEKGGGGGGGGGVAGGYVTRM